MEITNTFTKVWLLAPSFLVYWLVLTAASVGAWYFWTRLHRTYTFKWQSPALAAFALTFYAFATAALNIHHNGLLVGYHQAQTQAAAQAQQAAPTNTQPIDPVVQLKNEFLRAIEQLANDPSQITEENLKKFDAAFAPLFKTDADRAKVYGSVKKYYDCQRYFWEDAMASYKAKTIVKSDSRKDCEKEDGTFFEREKLFTADMIKSNETAISNMAARKRVPASDGKDIELTEEMIRQSLDTQVGLSKAVRKLLERK